MIEGIKIKKVKIINEEKETTHSKIVNKITAKKALEKELVGKTIYEILQYINKPLTSKELWELSKLEIQEFYSQLTELSPLYRHSRVLIPALHCPLM